MDSESVVSIHVMQLSCSRDYQDLMDDQDVNSNVEKSFIEHLNIKKSEITQNIRKTRKKLKDAPGTSYAHTRDSSDENSNFEGNDDQEKVNNIDDKVSTSEIDKTH